jgi:hypothetical protein
MIADEVPFVLHLMQNHVNQATPLQSHLRRWVGNRLRIL